MATTILHPTAGFIPDIARGAEPGPLRAAERALLWRLAEQVKAIAAQPAQQERRDLWYRHNQLASKRPMLLVFPEDSWVEILGEDQLELRDPFWRQQEWYLRHLIYRAEKLPDDFVIEPELWVTRVVRWGDWGLSTRFIHSADNRGSWVYDPPLKDPADLQKLRFPRVEVDEGSTQREYVALGEVFGDLLAVHIHCQLPQANLITEATSLRGIEQVLLDMHERPAWLHELMAFLTEGLLRGVRYLGANLYLTLNNRHHYTDSGGLGYTRELPGPDFDGVHVRPRDLWGFGVAQEFAGVGPRQHSEFLLDYQLRILEQCGLVAYGCCEPYTHKFAMLKRVPRLRRVSVSPWCDVEKAAANLEDKYILSWKANPAILVGGFDPADVRRTIRQTLTVTRDCVPEIIMKDTFTLEGQPARLEEWCRIARAAIQQM
jgi:hypothetical protein